MSGQRPCEVSWKLNKFEYAGGWGVGGSGLELGSLVLYMVG